MGRRLQMAPTRTVGIDLGTTHSVVARVNEVGHTEIVPDREGHLLVPSAVLFDDTRTIVGEEARLRGKLHPERLAACIKRDMGAPFYSQTIGGERLPPEVIQACILNKLRQNVLSSAGEECSAVIAVPAYFNDAQRRATAEAGVMAGFQVMDILNEPAAAALAYGEQTRYLFPDDCLGRGHYLLVYDLGGFTFQATLLEIDAGIIKTIATEYDKHLGGHDWDMRLVDYFAEQIIRQQGADPREDPGSLDDLLYRAVTAKLALGLRLLTTVTLGGGNRPCNIRLTRDDFLRLTSDLLERTAAVTERLLDRAGIRWADVPSVLLVGGATQMPAVGELILARTGREPLKTVNAAEAVARGTAIYAANLLGASESLGRRPTFKITNVSTYSLGIEGVDPKTKHKVNKILIPRGTQLPVVVKKDFVTKSSAQQTITIVVLEGEDPDPSKCTIVGRAVLRGLPVDLAAQWPVEVTYAYSANGRLTIDARVRYTDRSAHLEMHRFDGMSEENLLRWKTVIAQESGFAAYRAVLEHAKHVRSSQPIAISAGETSDQQHSENGILSFLKRYMPFAFHRKSREDAVRDGNAPPEKHEGLPAKLKSADLTTDGTTH